MAEGSLLLVGTSEKKAGCKEIIFTCKKLTFEIQCWKIKVCQIEEVHTHFDKNGNIKNTGIIVSFLIYTHLSLSQ